MIPGAILSWYVALVLGLISLGIRDSLCPSENLVSGVCMGDFVELTTDILTITFSGISAILVVVTSVLIAPSNRVTIARTAFVAGSIAAAVFLYQLEFEVWREFVSAILFGGATSYFTVNKLRRELATE